MSVEVINIVIVLFFCYSFLWLVIKRNKQIFSILRCQFFPCKKAFPSYKSSFRIRIPYTLLYESIDVLSIFLKNPFKWVQSDDNV